MGILDQRAAHWPHQFSAHLIPAVLLLIGVGCSAEPTSTDSLAALEKTASAYNIEIIAVGPSFPVKTFHGPIDGKELADSDLQIYSRLFAIEFSLYPPELTQRALLKRVVICRELSFDGQLRNAIPDFEHDTLYLDGNRGAYDKTYLRKVIHHEFFHIIDYRDDGSVYKDDRWASLNRDTFRYGNGGKNVQDMAETSVLTDKYPGFLNHYSTTGVEEDKAEMFANLIVDPEYVDNRAAADRVILAKVFCMKENLARFCPQMNDAFWEKVRLTKRFDK